MCIRIRQFQDPFNPREMALAWPVGATYGNHKIAMSSRNIFKEVNTEMAYKLFVSKKKWAIENKINVIKVSATPGQYEGLQSGDLPLGLRAASHIHMGLIAPDGYSACVCWICHSNEFETGCSILARSDRRTFSVTKSRQIFDSRTGRDGAVQCSGSAVQCSAVQCSAGWDGAPQEGK